ncbi:hypothetical protein EXIGLDRAFT_751271 [Exidia glandulosa HHB12029]|uniref:F-box domain-containing protein n=1 Tax=Exidia glandulosa HHB12029 TaxID=1314781 RepID=A0A165FL83_EXIGL|nr:hypothetical protein EXIGLDRAFT_751271 [Exidia glandulosa HHB12029]
MSAYDLEPNREASGAEAVLILARADIDQAEVDLAKRRLALAETTFAEAKARHEEAEALFPERTAALEDAARFTESARDLNTSVHRLSVTRAPLHPVRRVPLEVLGIIFEHSLPEWAAVPLAHLSATELGVRQSPPFRLASVCRLWRFAALACPRLWACIKLNLKFMTPHNAGSWLDYVSTLIERSAQTPLCIQIARLRPHSEIDGPVIDTLISSLSRCTSLLLDLDHVFDTDGILDIMHADLPVLRGLRLGATTVHPTVDRTRIFSHTPMLSYIKASFPLTGTRLCVPELITAEVQNCTVSDLSALLTAAQSLRNLRVSNLPTVVDLTPSTSWPSIRILDIRAKGYRNDAVGSLGQYLQFPNIGYLTLTGSWIGGRDRMAYFAATSGTMPLLTRLDLFEHNLDVDGALFMQGLSSCPALATINFCNMQLTRKGFRELCNFLGRPFDHGIWPCPQLKTVGMSYSTFTPDCVQEDVVTLVQKRVDAAQDLSGTTASRPALLVAVVLPQSSDATVRAKIRALLPTMG